MMETIKIFKFFSIADYKEEEEWLREKSKEGYRLIKLRGLCHYTFEKTDKEEIIYRLDFPNNDIRKDYKKMYEDFGRKYLFKHNGFAYFSKKKSDIVDKNDGEIFSDRQSALEMVNKIYKNFILSLIPVFLFTTWSRYDDYVNGFKHSIINTSLFILFTLIYLYVFIYCGLKLKKIQKELK